MAIIVRRHPRTESKQHRTGRPKLSLTLNSRQHVYLHIYVARVCLWRLYRMLAMRMRYEKRGICFTECDSAVEEARPLELTRMRHFQAVPEKKEEKEGFMLSDFFLSEVALDILTGYRRLRDFMATAG